jgi:integrase
MASVDSYPHAGVILGVAAKPAENSYPTMALSDTSIRNAKPAKRPRKLFDTGGLYLLVQPSGARWWRLKYRFAGKEKLLSLGVYPAKSLSHARDDRDKARKLLASGVDPSAKRQADEAARRLSAENSFKAVAELWLERQDVAEVTASKNRWLLESFIYPEIGSRPINEITPRELLNVLRKIEKTGKLETASRAKNKAGQVFRFAILEGIAENDPTAALRGALKAPIVKHHAAITDPKKMGELLRAIDGFSGQPATMYALRLAPLVFVRPGELRKAEWAEFDLDAALWRIPGPRMKMKAAHLVPLSKQAVAILRSLRALTGRGHLLFPSIRSAQRPMSENTVNAALRRLGYTNAEMTGHGFRSMASTRLNEMGWRADAIERQLAHAESNKVRDAYTSAAQYLDERKKMMQAWADYLDGLRTGADVVPIKRKAS